MTMIEPQTMTPELAAALDLRPEIIRRADEFEAGRRLPADLVRRMAEARLFAGAIPQSHGGTSRSPMELFETIEALAYADGSVGWCTMIYLITGVLCGYLSPEGAGEVFADPATLICGATAPSGRARIADGGHVVDGHWKWGSGSNNADWICGGTVVKDEGARHDSGEPKVEIMVFRRSEVEILDNWNPFGLRGTGSNDFKVSGVFVPRRRSFTLGATAPQVDEPLFRFPFFSLFGMGVAAIPLGLAARAFDEFREIARVKVPMWRTRAIAERTAVQNAAAEAEALIQSGRAYLMAALRSSWARLLSGAEVTGEERVQHRLAAAHAAHAAVKAVQLLYLHAGGSAIHGDCQLQRCLRDVNVTTQHMMLNPTVFEQTGLYLLHGGPYSKML